MTICSRRRARAPGYMQAALLVVAGVATASADLAPRIAFNTITTTTLTTSDPVRQVTADFNKDGHLDVMVTGSEVRLFTGDGTGALKRSTGFFFAQSIGIAA